MNNKVDFFPTSFCMITLNDIKIKHLQVGNIDYNMMFLINRLRKIYLSF